MNYHDALNRIYTANAKGRKATLASMQAMLELFGLPQETYKIIHVAGTNGKGSTATKVATALMLEGYKVGLYTSPHISNFCERIQINGAMIPEDAVLRRLNEIFQLADLHGIPLTFFEYATLLAFLYFAEQKVEYVVLETGLGGRLDATNTCLPILSIITSISLDHMDLLGDTIDKIAYEKAGIMKPGIPCVVGPSVPRAVVQERAKVLNCPLTCVDGTFLNYEEENRAIAKAALELLLLQPENIREGIQALPPCRFQEISADELQKLFAGPVPKRVILDVAHNPDGIRKLFLRIAEPATVAVGFSKDKDVACSLQELKEVSALFLVQADSPRAMGVEAMSRLIPKAEYPVFAHENLRGGIESAFCYAAEKRQILVICGTFYIMGESRRFLGLP